MDSCHNQKILKYEPDDKGNGYGGYTDSGGQVGIMPRLLEGHKALRNAVSKTAGNRATEKMGRVFVKLSVPTRAPSSGGGDQLP